MAARALRLAACVRWLDVRPEIDSLTGEVTVDARRGGFSDADRAALEVALALAESWEASVDLVAVGGAEIEAALRELSAAGVDRVTRLEGEDVAAALATALAGVDLVVCGDVSLDGGSGAVPAFVAHHLGVAQALGLVAVDAGRPGELVGTRRLGGGRLERVRVTAPAVVSVEGSVASLRRAPLPALVASATRPIEVRKVDAVEHAPNVVESGPWRPRARTLPPPVGETPRERIVALTGALVDRTPPRTVELEPEAAADAIVDQLRQWGYL